MNFKKAAAGILSAAMIAGCVCSLPAETNPFVIVSEAAKKLKAPEVTSVTADETSVTLEWEEVEGADGYVLYRYSAKQKTYIATASFTDTTYTVGNLDPGTTYRFRLAAYISRNGKKAAQKQTSVIKTTTEKRSGPSNVTGSAASDYIKLRWDNADNADIYRIYCREDGENEYTMIGKAIKNDYTARKLKSDTTYHFKVESLTKNGSKYVIQGISSELTVRTKLPDFLKVPDFTITDVDGKEYLITEFADKPMVIFFWVKDNNDVDRYLAYLDTLYKKYGDSVNFIMINCDHKSLIKNVKEYIAAQNLSMNIYFDWTLDGLSKQGTNITPYLFSVNANGELAKKFTGTLNNEAILKTVEKALQ